MNKKHIVRLYKSELSNFKNIRYGEIKYINYTNVESHGCLEPHDVFGIYGQNGSGKTALVDVLAKLVCLNLCLVSWWMLFTVVQRAS